VETFKASEESVPMRVLGDYSRNQGTERTKHLLL